MQIFTSRKIIATAATPLGPQSVPAIAPAVHDLRRCFAAAVRVFRIGAFAALAVGLPCNHLCAKTATHDAVSVNDPYAGFVAEASGRFGLPQSWLRAVIHVESGGNPKAVSPKGAMGLMQLMPETWAALRVQFHLGSDPFDPHDNIIGGAAYLRELFDRFGASGFLAAYNAGPGRFQGYLSGLRPLHDETKHYLSTLAQMLPDLPIGNAMPATIAASDWRAAQLFAGQKTTSGPTAPTPSSSSPDNAPAAPGFAFSPQSNGLFVPAGMTERR